MLSVAIITKNEESNIERCLRSVQWADEIVLVDAHSSDSTAEKATKLNANVLQRGWDGYATQKEYAVAQCSHDWVLSIDADEEVPETLRAEILHAVDRTDEYNGYEIPRKSFFLGAWMQYGGWYPGYQLRLFRKSKTRMNHRPVHEGFLTEGSIGRLQSALNHYTYESIHHYVEKMNDYTSLDVHNKIVTGRVVHWYHLLLNPLSSFFRMFFSLKGYKDGFRGFLLAYYSSFSTLTLYAKCWEYQQAQQGHADLPPTTSEMIAELKRLSS